MHARAGVCVGRLQSEYKDAASFQIAVGVLAFLYALGFIVAMILAEERLPRWFPLAVRLPIPQTDVSLGRSHLGECAAQDLVVTCLFALLWLISSALLGSKVGDLPNNGQMTASVVRSRLPHGVITRVHRVRGWEWLVADFRLCQLGALVRQHLVLVQGLPRQGQGSGGPDAGVDTLQHALTRATFVPSPVLSVLLVKWWQRTRTRVSMAPNSQCRLGQRGKYAGDVPSNAPLFERPCASDLARQPRQPVTRMRARTAACGAPGDSRT